nr:hypothetical protein 210p_00023 [Serratia entomophila]ULG11758.1 hypothetical protein 626p_00123 [Serratia entomophila]ULG11903.1 hypothetical protein 1100p_00024 [Serratia entomophila]ULG12464.1 hypothetical protein Moraki_2p1_00023 [Serratia entomophila]ULG14368.1 hypothetical protein 142p_00061 [Serratia proteamaculans]
MAYGPRQIARHLHPYRHNIVFPDHHFPCSGVFLLLHRCPAAVLTHQFLPQQHDGPLRRPTRCAVRASASLRLAAARRSGQSPPNPCGFRPSRVASDGNVQGKPCSWLTPARSPPRWGFKESASRSFWRSPLYRCSLRGLFLRGRHWHGALCGQGYASPAYSPVRSRSTSRLCAAASTPPLSASLIPRPGLCATAPDSPRRQKAKRGIHQKEACYG